MAAEPEQQGGRARVSDPEEYNQQARLRAINNARQRVEDTIEQSMVRLVTDDEFGEADRQQVVRATLYTYLSNIYWLMVEAASGDSETRATVTEREFGEVRLDPPEEFVRIVDGQNRGYPRAIGDADLDAETWTITGVRGYLTAPDVFEAEWTLPIEERHGEPQPVTKKKTTHMPVHISRSVFDEVNGFLNRAGFDADLETEQHRAVVDQDVLEEVEEWRQQHIQ